MASDARIQRLSMIASEGSIRFVGGMLRIPLYYAIAIILTNNLGPDYYGLWTLGESIQRILLTLALLGLPKALYRFIAYYKGMGKLGKAKNLLVSAFIFSAIVSLALVIALVLVPENILDNLFNETGIGDVLHLMVMGIPFYALILLLSSSYIGFKKVRYQVFTEVVGLPLFQVITAVIVFYVIGNGIDAWVKGYVFSLFLMSIVSSIIFFKKIWLNLAHISFDSLDYKEVINYAWPLTINAALTLVVGREIDFVLLGIFSSAREVGIYRVYLYFVMPLQVMVASLAQIYQPTVTELIAQMDLKEAVGNFKKIAKWTLQINIFLLLILFFVGDILVYYLFGEEYLVAPVVLSILALGKVLDSSVGPTLMTLEAFGKSRLILFNSILVVVLQVGLAYFLIPRFGLVGAGIARAFSLVMTNYIELLEVWWLYRITPFNPAYGWTCGSGFAALFVGFCAQYTLHLNKMVISGGGAFLASIIIYVMLLFLTPAFDSEDSQVLSNLFERLKAKVFAKDMKVTL